MPLNVTCKLNNKFKQALQGQYVSYSYGRILINDPNIDIELTLGETTCCGVDELNFQGIQENYEILALSEDHWKELIAKYIKGSCERADHRIVFVGIPTKVGYHSMYNLDFYKRLRHTLKEFGFKELCKPYRNGGSGNTIVVLAGQMP